MNSKQLKFQLTNIKIESGISMYDENNNRITGEKRDAAKLFIIENGYAVESVKSGRLFLTDKGLGAIV